MMSKMPEETIQQAGVFAVSKESGEWMVLLVSSNSGKRWVIPKGIVETGCTPEDTAEMEAFEEAGIKGALNRSPVGFYSYRKWGHQCDVTVFVYHITRLMDEWPEKAIRRRRWLSIDGLPDVIDERIPRELLGAMRDVLEKHERPDGK
jgi:8-oxo-dGTP pyrophosphatase MutT (NUDIX family)